MTALASEQMRIHNAIILLFLTGGSLLAQEPLAPESVKPIRPAAQGLPVDKNGGPTIDPTENVKALNEAAQKRQDDLRDLTVKLVASELKRVDDLRIAGDANAKDLRSSETQRVNDLLKQQASYEEKLQDKESKRIDSIRAVDVAQTAAQNAQVTQTAAVLASQVAAAAEAARSLVASSAATIADQQRAFSSQITDRVNKLEQSQYEIRGRSNVSDPQSERNSAMLEKLTNEEAAKAARQDAFGSVYGGGVTLVIALVAVGGFIYTMATRSRIRR